MALLTAKRIHSGYGWLPERSAIEVADDGTIVSIVASDEGATRFDGVLVPGFVNVHCHLELSHMRGAVPEHTGLIPFLKQIPRYRNEYTDEQKRVARGEAYEELVRNGVVAVGDIANTTDSLDVRSMGKLHFHTFVESIGFNDANAGRSFDYALKVYIDFAAQGASGILFHQSIAPHAPYSVSQSLFRRIGAHEPDKVMCIHNQESIEEDHYFKNKDGQVADLLHTLGIDDSAFQPTGRSSLQSYAEWLDTMRPIVLVHNTYTGREDVRCATEKFKKVSWCLCPNANLYIEQRLPDIDMLVSEGAALCVGTDSLASNHQLSILTELQSIHRYFPHIGWEQLFSWATLNGAKALQMEDRIGSIEAGKQPGVLQILRGSGGEFDAVKRIA